MNSTGKKKTQKEKNRLSSKNTGIKEKKSEINIHESDGKKTWSVNDLKEIMKPTNEELEYRKNKSKESDIFVKSSRFFRCTKCLKSFKSIINDHKKVPVHPMLGVLMCKKCSDYYEDGEFSVDSDGEDKYCRWCGEGGTIFGCAKCICGFCSNCIKKHFESNYFKEVRKDDNWLCFFCNPKPLWALRFICSLAVQTSEGGRPEPDLNVTDTDINNDQNSSSENLTLEILSNGVRKNLRKSICIYSDDESEEQETLETPRKKPRLSNDSSMQENKCEKFESLKSNVLKELKKVVKLSEYHLSFGVDWSNKTLTKLEKSDILSTEKDLANECRKIKWFLTLISTYLVQLCNTVNETEKSLMDFDEPKDSLKQTEKPDKTQPSYDTILKFLEFINTQIKIFIERGIPLSEVLDTEFQNSSNIKEFLKRLTKPVSSPNCEKKNNPIENKTESTPNSNTDCVNKEETEKQKSDDEGEDKDEDEDENILDVIQGQNLEKNSSDLDEEESSSRSTSVENNDLKDSDLKNDFQEVLAILENA